MRVLVTGASGFIGRNLLLALPRDWSIVAAYHSSEDFPTWLSRHELGHIAAWRVDLSGVIPTDSIGGRHFDVCVFLSANGDPALSARNVEFDLRSNTITLIRTLTTLTFDHFIYFSSGAVYDGLRGNVTPSSPVRPRLPYAVSKLASEHYLAHFVHEGRTSSGTVVRFFGAFGPFEPARKIYSRLIEQFAIRGEGGFAVRGNGRNFIDAMYIDDAVRAVRLLIDRPAEPGETRVLDLCCGQPLTVGDLVAFAARTFGVAPAVTYEGEVPEFIEFRSVDRTMSDSFGFSPRVPLADGLRALAAHLRSHR